MYKLTIELADKQALIDFVIGLGGLPAGAQVVETPKAAVVEQAPVVEEKPKKTKVVKKEVVEEAELPPVIPAPEKHKQEEPKYEAPAIDRGAVIATVSKSIQDLSTAGMKGGDIAAALADIYVKANCPAGVKISQLDDTQLAAFFPHFTAFVAHAKGAQTVTTQTQSFV